MPTMSKAIVRKFAPIAARYDRIGKKSARINARLPRTSAKALHVLNRLGYGAAPGDVEQVLKMGVDKYIDRQLHPEQIPLPVALTHELNILDTLKLGPVELFREYGPALPKGGGLPDAKTV